MAGKDDGMVREATPKRRGRMMTWLIAAAILASLGGCAQSAPAPDSSAEQAPGSFNLHLNGRLTNAFGAATP